VFLPPWDAVTHASDQATSASSRASAPASASGSAPDRAHRADGRRPGARWAAVRASAIAGGAAAAGLGLGGIAAAVLLLWIGSPFPDSGLGGALHTGAGLWLLAQGADLVREDTLSGDPAPVALAPMLLSVLPAWLLYRGAASAVSAAAESDDDADAEHVRSASAPDLRAAALVTGWLLAGYLTLAAIAVVYTSGGPVHIDPLSALYVPLFAACAAGCGAWSGCGRPGLALWLPGPQRVYAREAAAALRAAGIAGGILLAGGALLGAAALAWHAGPVGRTYDQLSGPLSGKLAVLLLALGLVPNLVVWAVSYALGVGFTVGMGSAVAPAGASGYVLLPGFPLLAALPGTGTSWVGWTTLAVPAAAALVVGRLVGNGGRPPWGTVRVAAEAALALGVGFAVLAAWSGGPLGTRRLADFGPSCWLTGGAAAGWILAVALPLSLVLRYHLAHPPTPWRSLLSGAHLPRFLTSARRSAPAVSAQPSDSPASARASALLAPLASARASGPSADAAASPGPRGWSPKRLLRMLPFRRRSVSLGSEAPTPAIPAAAASLPGAVRSSRKWLLWIPAIRRRSVPLGSEAPTPAIPAAAASLPGPLQPSRKRLLRMPAIRRKAVAPSTSAIPSATTPLPDLRPSSSGDPLPWPSPPPLPLFPPPLPDLPPSAPPPPPQDPLPAPAPPAEKPDATDLPAHEDPPS